MFWVKKNRNCLWWNKAVFMLSSKDSFYGSNWTVFCNLWKCVVLCKKISWSVGTLNTFLFCSACVLSLQAQNTHTKQRSEVKHELRDAALPLSCASFSRASSSAGKHKRQTVSCPKPTFQGGISGTWEGMAGQTGRYSSLVCVNKGPRGYTPQDQCERRVFNQRKYWHS